MQLVVLHMFVPNKSFGQLLDISCKNSIYLRLLNSELSYIEVWYADQKSEVLEVEDKIIIILDIS